MNEADTNVLCGGFNLVVMNTPGNIGYFNNFCTLRTELKTDAAPMLLWFADYQNRFQMEAPVAPSRSLQEASVGMAEAFSARDVFMKRS